MSTLGVEQFPSRASKTKQTTISSAKNKSCILEPIKRNLNGRPFWTIIFENDSVNEPKRWCQGENAISSGRWFGRNR